MPVDREQLEILKAKHPEYTKWLDAWNLYHDVTEKDWSIELKKKHLIKGQIEQPTDFTNRAEMSEFLGESGIAVKRVVSSLFRDMPTRSGFPPKLKAMVDEADRRGNSIDMIMMDIAEVAITYGSAHILLDKKQIPPGVVVSNRKQEIELGIDRPFTTIYDPRFMWNWEEDDDGQYVWVRFVEDRTIQDSLDGSRIAVRIFREFDRNIWRIWKVQLEGSGDEKEETLQLVAEGEHNLGMVPVATLAPLKQFSAATGKSFIDKSSRADIKRFRRESDLEWDLYLHSHPVLKVWSMDPLKKIGVGSSTYLHLMPDRGAGFPKEDAEYISPGTNTFEPNFRAIELAQLEAYRHVGIDPMGVISSGDAVQSASGVSRAWSFSTSEARLLAFIADKLEQFEYDVWNIAKAWTGESGNKIKTIWPDNFDMVSSMDLIKAYNEFGPWTKSKVFHSSIKQRISSQLVGDIGAEDFEKMTKEIEKEPIPDMSKKRAEQDRSGRVNRNPDQKEIADKGVAPENPTGPEPKSRET